MSDQPTVEEELLRKAGETLLWLSNEYARGAITHDAYILALQVFDMTCLGLVPTEYSNWAKDERDKAHMAINDRQILINAGNGAIVYVQLYRAMGEIKVSRIHEGRISHKILQYEEEIDPVRKASETFPYVIRKLVNTGYLQIL